MLIPAYLHKEEVSKKLGYYLYNNKSNCIRSGTYINLKEPISISDTFNWNDNQQISLIDGAICGYFDYNIERDSHIGFGLTVVLFDKSLQSIRDLFTFLEEAYNSNLLYKLEWSVTTDNPADKMYKKIIQRFGGKVVGVKENTFIDGNGNYHDLKLYAMYTKKGKEFFNK